MARAESGNQIFTGDLYFRSWQLQRQFQQLSNSPNTQDIESSFREPPRIKRLHIGLRVPRNISKEYSHNKNTSNNLVLFTQKNLKLIRRKYGAEEEVAGVRGGDEGKGVNKSGEPGEAQGEEKSKMKCSTPATENSATRITIIQGHHRLEPPNNFVGKTTGGNIDRENFLCFPSIVDKLIGDESEVPT